MGLMNPHPFLIERIARCLAAFAAEGRRRRILLRVLFRKARYPGDRVLPVKQTFGVIMLAPFIEQIAGLRIRKIGQLIPLQFAKQKHIIALVITAIAGAQKIGREVCSFKEAQAIER
jgi:hypothetical protein